MSKTLELIQNNLFGFLSALISGFVLVIATIILSEQYQFNARLSVIEDHVKNGQTQYVELNENLKDMEQRIFVLETWRLFEEKRTVPAKAKVPKSNRDSYKHEEKYELETSSNL